MEKKRAVYYVPEVEVCMFEDDIITNSSDVGKQTGAG